MDSYYKQEVDADKKLIIRILGWITIALSITTIVFNVITVKRFIDGGWSMTLGDILIFIGGIVIAFWGIADVILSFIYVNTNPSITIWAQIYSFGATILISVFDGVLIGFSLFTMFSGSVDFKNVVFYTLLANCIYLLIHLVIYYFTRRHLRSQHWFYSC